MGFRHRGHGNNGHRWSKYKVGDKVKIRSLDWYNANKTKGGEVYLESIVFLQLMSKYCGKVATIICACRYGYSLDIDGGHYNWVDEMFEENINDMETKEIIIPQGWEIDKVEGNKVILKEGKKELPKTWFECLYKYKGDLEYIHNSTSNIASHVANGFFLECDKNLLPKGLGKPVLALMQLLVCREMYRGGWKPDWSDCKSKWAIEYVNNHIAKANYIQTSKVLSFQSEEIRDLFLKNFKSLIEEAKELI